MKIEQISFKIERDQGHVIVTDRVIDTSINGQVEWCARMFSEANDNAIVTAVDLTRKVLFIYKPEKVLRFKKFNGDTDALYEDPLYQEKFIVLDANENAYTVTLQWNQGLGNNYRFVTDLDTYLWPEEVKWIEVK